MELSLQLLRDFVRLHPLEAARALEKLPAEEAASVLVDEPADAAAAVLEKFVPIAAQDALAEMEPASAAALLTRLSARSGGSLLAALPSALRTARLEATPEPWRTPLAREMEPAPFQVAAVMDRRPMSLVDDFTVDEAIDFVRGRGGEATGLVFVIDREQHLLGRLPTAQLLRSAPHRRLATLALGAPTPVAADAPWAGLERDPVWLANDTIAVSDADGRIVGSLSHRRLRTLVQAGNDPHAPRRQTIFWPAVEMALTGYRVTLEATTSVAGRAMARAEEDD